MMYWTDWGVSPKIEQAEMDGSARRAIVTGNLAWPNGITIDQAKNLLYWADAKLDKIEVSDLNGGSRQLIMSSAANIHPRGLAVYQNILYWTDWNSKSISRYNLSSGNRDMVVTGLQKPMDIHVFDPSLIFSGIKFIYFQITRGKICTLFSATLCMSRMFYLFQVLITVLKTTDSAAIYVF